MRKERKRQPGAGTNFLPVLSIIVWLLLLVSCPDPHSPGEGDETLNNLVRGETKGGRLDDGPEQWFWFEASDGCRYDINVYDKDNDPEYSGDITASFFHEDMETPYEENREDGPFSLTASSCERIYIRIEQKPETEAGDFGLYYSIDDSIEPQTWTIMMYMNADNNLEADILFNLKELITGYHEYCGINIVVLLDKKLPMAFYGFKETDFTDTRLFAVNRYGIHRIGGAPEFPEISLSSRREMNMGDANTLKKFISFCKHNFPARHDALVITGHGYGPAGFCGDDSSGGDRLHIGEMSFYLDDEDAVSLLGFNTCYMGNIETAYQFRYDGDP
ncbi:MAG: hypothetical protein JW881_19340, partial [Spirochaetales bacterium]|nr:hypothetical protein [Spirochaetales bacterium]